MLHWQQSKLKDRSGLTLIELVIAISMSLLLMSALYSVYITSFKSYQRSVSRSELDQNARISLERITRDLRQTSDIVTALPPTNTDQLNPAPNNIQFIDGHNTSKIQYIEYKLEGNNLMRKSTHYYFSSDPDTWVSKDSKDQFGNTPTENIDENVIKADRVQSLQFYGTNTVIISIVVSDGSNNIYYSTQVLGRNAQ